MRPKNKLEGGQANFGSWFKDEYNPSQQRKPGIRNGGN